MASISTRVGCIATIATALLPLSVAQSQVDRNEARARASLCAPDETLIASCAVGLRLVSVCAAGKVARYRFGRPGRVEIDADRLSYAYRSFAGGGEEQVSFVNGGFRYILYDRVLAGKWDREGHRRREFQSGIWIERGGRRVADRACNGDQALFSGQARALLKDMPRSQYVEHDRSGS